MKKLLLLTFLALFSVSVNAETIVTESTSNSTVTTNGSMETTVKSPPPYLLSLALVIIVIYALSVLQEQFKHRYSVFQPVQHSPKKTVSD